MNALSKIFAGLSLLACVGFASAANLESTVTAVDQSTYTFYDLYSNAIGTLSFNQVVEKLNFSFNELTAYTGDAISLTLNYANNGGNTISKTIALSPGIDAIQSGQLGGHNAVFSSAVLGYMGPVITPVPEPETYALLLAGLGLLGVIGRRKTKQTKQVV